MDQIESLDRISSLDDARDVDLVRALTNHLDVYIALAKRSEHASSDTDQVDHLFSDEGKDGHIMMHRDLISWNVSLFIV